MIKDYSMIFLDRDGTLNPDPGYIANVADFNYYDFTLQALKSLAAAGQRFCIITNQSGVSRGLIKNSDLDEIHSYIRNSFAENQIPLVNIYFCTDHPDKPTEFRKPGPGMFRQAAADFDLELTECLMVGDSEKDIRAGADLGMDTMLVLTGEGKKTLQALNNSLQPTYVAENLLDGAGKLLGADS